MPSKETVGSLGAAVRAELEPRFGAREATQMVRIIWQSLKGWSVSDLALKSDETVSVFVEQSFRRIAARLLAGEPLQYILGEAYFYGMTFHVTPATLIPRPETAELVDMIVDRYRSESDLRVLDIATGSGCIAIALARNLSFSQVSALDISAPALEIARENAKTLKAKIDFRQADILAEPLPSEPQFDIIVSNPPYIAESEKTEMDIMVTDHEPSLALFVPDSDPLRFYSAISRYASSALRPGGTLWFEINPLFADQLKQMLEKQNSWTDINLSRDMQGKVRFASATKSAE